MLLVLIILQLMPQPAKDAMAEAVRDRRSWQAVKTELTPQWTVSAGRLEHRRPTMTLVIVPPVQPAVDPRSYALATELPAGPKIELGLWDDALAGTAAPAAASAPAGQTMVIDPADAPAGSAAPLLGDLRQTALLAPTVLIDDDAVPVIDGVTGGAPAGGFPGGGIGSAVPEPSMLALGATALPLVLRRRRR